MKWNKWTGEFELERARFCEFGITESILGASLASVFAGGLEGAGVGAGAAGFLGGAGAGAVGGAALGAGSTLLTGGDPGLGALTGALTGGAVGGAGAAGLGTVGQVAAGAGAGALGSEITGGNPLFGAITGGGAGLASGLTGASAPSGGGTSITTTPAAGASGGTSAAAPGPVALSGGSAAPMDLTAGTDAFGLRPASSLGLSDTSGGSGVGGSPGTTPGIFAGQADGTAGGSGGGNFGGGGGGGGDGGGGVLSKLGLSGNAGQLLGIAGLGATLLKGPQDVPGAATLNRQAGEAATMGRTLEAYQQSGTLPSGLQSLVDTQTSAAEAQTRSRFAALGLAGSTQEAQALSSLKQAKAAEVATIADKLAAQGVNWANLSGQEFSKVIEAQQNADARFTAAITSFARGLSGGGLATSTNNNTNTG